MLYHIFFYVPEDFKESVKEAMFKAGAGRVGNYDSCSWEILGEGQFKPLDGSNPYLGEQDKIEKVKEYRVEMVCKEEYLKKVIDALKSTHPYEEVAYGVIELKN